MQRRFSFPVGSCRLAPVPCITALFVLAVMVFSLSARADRALAQRFNQMALDAQQPSASAQPASYTVEYQPSLSLESPGRRSSRACQVPLPPVGDAVPFRLAVRLGALVSPRFKFDGGVDVTLGGLRLIPGLTSRVDADAIVSANFGGVSTLIPITFDQIYRLDLPASSRVYVGGGAGVYLGDRTRFGGKLIAGAEFNRFGVEGNLHFAGSGDSLLTVQARFRL